MASILLRVAKTAVMIVLIPPVIMLELMMSVSESFTGHSRKSYYPPSETMDIKKHSNTAPHRARIAKNH